MCDRTDRERDRVELLLAKWAMADGKPVLGVCRGMQLVNIAAGGTLYQDLATQYTNGIKHDYFPFGGRGHARDYLAHEVRIAEDSRLAPLFGAGTIKVNSMHHQGVRDPGAGLVATAHAPDGLIEALEGTGPDRKSTRLNSSHANISYAVFCLKKKNNHVMLNIFF